MNQVSIYINDQLVYQTPADSKALLYHIHADGGVIRVADEHRRTVFFYVPRRGQYGKIQILDSNTTIRINE